MQFNYNQIQQRVYVYTFICLLYINPLQLSCNLSLEHRTLRNLWKPVYKKRRRGEKKHNNVLFLIVHKALCYKSFIDFLRYSISTPAPVEPPHGNIILSMCNRCTFIFSCLIFTLRIEKRREIVNRDQKNR